MIIGDRWPTSQTVHGLPPRYYHCHLSNFETENEGMVEVIDKFISGVRPNLLLTGDPGRGKTHLSVGLYRWAVSFVGTWRAMWLDLPEFSERVKKGFNSQGGDDPFQELEEAKFFLALDDIFGRELSAFERDRILYAAIQKAHRNQTRLVVTTNYDLEQLKSMLAPHEFDRLLEGGQHVHLRGPSKRK